MRAESWDGGWWRRCHSHICWKAEAAERWREVTGWCSPSICDTLLGQSGWRDLASHHLSNCHSFSQKKISTLKTVPWMPCSDISLILIVFCTPVRLNKLVRVHLFTENVLPCSLFLKDEAFKYGIKLKKAIFMHSKPACKPKVLSSLLFNMLDFFMYE